ncbi:MAG: MFS transporter [Elusimicrobia bacterium]|nr:MFS transporter [Elusimicrobiota bacterium]
MGLDPIYVFFAVNYFAQGMGGLAYEPISYLLKDGLGLDSAGSANFTFWMTLPFLVKPLYGLVTDLLPIRSYRRRPHIVIVAGLAAASFIVLAGLKSYTYGLLLALLILVNVGTVGSDVVCDGVMVEQGKQAGATGVFQAVQIATLYAALVVSGLGGGWLVRHASYGSIFGLSAVFPMMIMGSAYFAREARASEVLSRGTRGLRELIASRNFWALSAVIFLWSFYPFLGTAQFYHQSSHLRLSPVYIGFLSTLSGAAGVLGAAFYGRVIGRRFSTAAMVRAAVWVGAPLSLLYLFYLGPVSVAVVTFIWGAAGVALRLALMDLAAQCCPAGAEATAFAVYMSVFNLSASASNTLGGNLYEALKARLSFLADPAYGSMAALTLIGTACTLACWPLLKCILPAQSKPSREL